MGRAIDLRDDDDGDDLRRLARRSKDSDQTRLLLALSVIYDGGGRTDAAKVGGVTLQIVRDWVLRFNADGPEGLENRWGPGPAPKLTAEHLRALAELVERGPVPAIHGVVRWRPATWRGSSTRCVRRLGGGKHHRPGAARDGLSQALLAAVPLGPERICGGGFKNLPRRAGEDSGAPRPRRRD